MRKTKTKYYTLEERRQYDRNRNKDPKRIAWSKAYKKRPERKYEIYKHSARIKNLEFNLSFEQFMTLWRKPCSYCQEEIDSIGIDRFDNEIGYILSNIISCCKTCNYMKRELSFEVFLDKCKKISNNYICPQ